MRKIGWTLVAVVLGTLPAAAADWLEPELPQYLSLRQQHATYLKEAFDQSVVLRAFIEPSFQFDYTVLLERRNGKNFIVTLKLDPELEFTLQRYDEIEHYKKEPPEADDKASTEHLAFLQKDLPPYPKEVVADRCDVEIDAEFAAKIEEAWRVMLEGTASVPYSGGLDGTFYHFSMRADGKTLAGRTWSPGLRTPTGRLVAMTEMMRDYCISRRENIIAKADTLIGAKSP